jgi:hypothetical protein
MRTRAVSWLLKALFKGYRSAGRIGGYERQCSGTCLDVDSGGFGWGRDLRGAAALYAANDAADGAMDDVSPSLWIADGRGGWMDGV